METEEYHWCKDQSSLELQERSFSFEHRKMLELEKKDTMPAVFVQSQNSIPEEILFQ
jgi:hypothetical protein